MASNRWSLNNSRSGVKKAIFKAKEHSSLHYLVEFDSKTSSRYNCQGCTKGNGLSRNSQRLETKPLEGAMGAASAVGLGADSLRKQADLSNDKEHRQAEIVPSLETMQGLGYGSINSEAKSTCRSVQVLLAEDNILHLKVASRVLSLMENTKVTAVTDGQQAVDEIHRQGGPDAFEIILTDLQMPHKGGIELVKDLRSLWPKSAVKVVDVKCL